MSILAHDRAGGDRRLRCAACGTLLVDARPRQAVCDDCGRWGTVITLTLRARELLDELGR